MVICYATLKLAEVVPRLFLLLSKNLIALDILGKRQTIEAFTYFFSFKKICYEQVLSHA